MLSLDLQSWLSLVSTLAILVALVFAGVQVREANKSRKDQAAVALIQSTQVDSFTRAMRNVGRLPANVSAEQVDASGDWAEDALVDFGFRLESIGYMVFLRLVSLEMADSLIGGLTLMYWSRVEAWLKRERERSGNPNLYEWCEWLAGQVRQRRAAGRHQPGHVEHRDWRE